MRGRLTDPVSGRSLEVETTEPGMQVYMGNWIDGSHPHLQHNAVALECQHFPDSPNHPDFPSTVLNPEDVYTQTTIFRLLLCCVCWKQFKHCRSLLYSLGTCLSVSVSSA